MKDIALAALSRGDPTPFARFFRDGVRFSADDWQALANMIPEPPKKGRSLKDPDDDAMQAARIVRIRERKELAKKPASARLPAHFRDRAISELTDVFWRKAQENQPGLDQEIFVHEFEDAVRAALRTMAKRRQRRRATKAG